MTAAAMIVLLALMPQQTSPQKPLSGQPCSGRELVGTWQLIEAQGKAVKSDGGTAYKHVTPTRFIVLNVDSTGLAAYAHGGPYKVSAGTYTEFIRQGVGTHLCRTARLEGRVSVPHRGRPLAHRRQGQWRSGRRGHR